VSVHQISPDEPLSPELVLVSSPELRAQALARLGPPTWPKPRLRAVEAPAAVVDEPYKPSFSALLVARVGQLALIFVVVTILVLAMSIVANAMR
jgi:hypothetical protein